MKLQREYPYMQFRQHWNETNRLSNLLGQCEAYVNVINATPILPDTYEELLQISLIRGAQSTTAIEGNNLEDEEIKRIANGQKLQPSKAYQEQEVRNILDSLNTLLKEVIHENTVYEITPDIIRRFHRLIAKDLTGHMDGLPGEWRQDERNAGVYRCPDPRDVLPLIERYCEWLKSQFGYGRKEQSFGEVVIQAIVAHIYFEWIHPFPDGNGRTGRLIEFYIMLRGGNPTIASHILSNHYNQTRDEYYRHLNIVRERQDLSSFIEYAVLGFRDGLRATLQHIGNTIIELTWQKLVHDRFHSVRGAKKSIERRKLLVLTLKPNKAYTPQSILTGYAEIARVYGKLNSTALFRDLQELKKMDLIEQTDSQYRLNVSIIRGNLVFASRRK